MASTPQEILQRLEKKGPEKVYALFGEERALIDEAVEKIKAKSLSASARDFNLDVFNGKDAPMGRILDAAMTLPAFAPRRLVIVQQADKLDLENAEGLLEYLKDPSPTTVLVFVAEKLDARTRIYKAIDKAGAVLRFARPKPREMPDIIRSRASMLGIKLEAGAVRALAEAVGADVSAAIQALEVLELYVGPNHSRPVTADDVVSVVSTTREESIFDLVDAVGMADRAQVLRGLDAMLRARERPLGILAMVARHYRSLIRARAAMDRGASRQELQEIVGVPPYFMDKLLDQARRQTLGAMITGLASISSADASLKGGRLDDARAMERLVLGLMRPAVS